MDSAEAFALELELLDMTTIGAGNVAKMQRICRRVTEACEGVPQHIKELGQLPESSHRERDLHRWVSRQVWRRVLPELYDFNITVTPDGVHQDTRVHSLSLIHI